MEHGRMKVVCAGDMVQSDASAAHKGGRNNVDLNQQGSRPRGESEVGLSSAAHTVDVQTPPPAPPPAPPEH